MRVVGLRLKYGKAYFDNLTCYFVLTGQQDAAIDAESKQRIMAGVSIIQLTSNGKSTLFVRKYVMLKCDISTVQNVK